MGDAEAFDAEWKRVRFLLPDVPMAIPNYGPDYSNPKKALCRYFFDLGRASMRAEREGHQ